MTTLKALMGDRIDTADKARAALSVFVTAGGLVGLALVVAAVVIGH